MRGKALVDSLRAKGGLQLKIDIPTTLANRYQSHLAAAPEVEIEGGIGIARIALPSHQSGIMDQVRARRGLLPMAAFIRRSRPDVDKSSRSLRGRVLTGRSGLLGARRGDELSRVEIDTGGT